MFDFSGQTVLVTGGSRGIGGAVSEAFLKAGAKVVAVFARNEQKAREFKDSLGEAGVNFFLEQLDVADYSEAEEFFKTFVDKYGKLDVLVNNAGIRRDSVLGMMSAEDWKAVLDINLGGTFNMCKFAVQLMMTERYGRIVNITSPSGQYGFEGQANYASSKAGQVALTKSLCKEVAKRKITVNCVSPGFIETDLIGDLPDEQVAAYKKSVPVKRFGTPAEVAHAVLFLSMKESAYITGSVLEVTGGL